MEQAYLCRSEADPHVLTFRGMLARVEVGEPIEVVFGPAYPYFWWRFFANFVKWMDSDYDSVPVRVLAAQAMNDLKIRGIDEAI